MAQTLQRKTVFVGLSGGVDSAVSAALLKEQGHIVVGVFIKTWHPDFLPCTWKEDRMDAMRVAAHLQIPFLTFDLEDAYKKGVADYLIREYAAGRTPNPDVLCNKEVKFGAFLKRALALGADAIATGHYAHTTIDPKTGTVHLHEGIDPGKDQSYFLWMLGQQELTHVLFPLGGMQKSRVRTLAKKFGLPNAERKDSQGVCFIGELDMKEFLKRFITTKPGNVIDVNGAVVGVHEGAELYTIGERHGFTITTKTPHDLPQYIIAKNVADNTLMVSSALTNHDARARIEIPLEQLHWMANAPREVSRIHARIRYHGDRMPCTVQDGGESLGEVILESPIHVAAGQSIVFYKGAECLGGGIVR